MVRRYMPVYRKTDAPKLDLSGFLLFGGGVGLLSYVLEIFGEHGLSAHALIPLAIASVALLAGYAWHARHVIAPMLPLELFRIRTFRVSVVGGFVTRLGIGGMPFLLPLLYQLGLGLPAWKAGLLTMPQAIAAMGMKVIGRKLLTRFGHRCVLIVNTVCLGIVIGLFALITPATHVGYIIALGFSLGFFASLQFTSMNTLVYADVQDEDASQAGSIASTGQQMSLSFGIAFGALLAGWFLGNMDQTNPLLAVPAIHKSILVLAAVTIVSSAVFRTLRSADGNNVSNRKVRVVETR